MDLAATASLIVATFELSVVRGVVNAIRTADISSGRGISASPLGPDPSPDIAPRIHLHPAAVYEPNDAVRAGATYPAPRYENRTAPLSGGGVPRHDSACEPQFNAAVCGWLTSDAVKPACPEEGPIPPVWKKLPPVPPSGFSRPRRVVKVVRQQPDIHHRGTLVDIHI